MKAQASKGKKKLILTYAFIWGAVASAMALVLLTSALINLVKTGQVEIISVVCGLASAAIAVVLLVMDRRAQPREQ